MRTRYRYDAARNRPFVQPGSAPIARFGPSSLPRGSETDVEVVRAPGDDPYMKRPVAMGYRQLEGSLTFDQAQTIGALIHALRNAGRPPANHWREGDKIKWPAEDIVLLACSEGRDYVDIPGGFPA